MSRDPNQAAICTCDGENTTSLYGKHSVSETTWKRCNVEEGIVVGKGISGIGCDEQV